MSKSQLFKLLRHQIFILENMDNNELSLDVWQEKYSTFAEIKPLYDNKVASLESFSFGHIVTEGYFVFKIRFLPEITSKMRIKFNNRLFDIKRIINIDEKDRLLKIITLEI